MIILDIYSISLLSRCVPDPTHLADLLTKKVAYEQLKVEALRLNNDDDQPSASRVQPVTVEPEVEPAALQARQNSTKEFFKMIELDDFFQKFLSDIYTAWRQILVLCAVSVGLWN